MSNRITVEAVKEAMEKTGLKLTHSRFATKDGTCGCPQWILYKASETPKPFVDWLEREFGGYYSACFRGGYDYAVDGKWLGQQDGYTVRMALLPPGKEE